MLYPLHALRWQDFENLVVQLCHQFLGPGTSRFSAGADGGRDAFFEGTADDYPSAREPWSGKLVIQAKHTENVNASCADGDFQRAMVGRKGQNGEVDKIAKLRARGECDGYLLFTNRKLSAPQAEALVTRIRQATGLEQVAILGSETIASHLDRYPAIAARFRTRFSISYGFEDSGSGLTSIPLPPLNALARPEDLALLKKIVIDERRALGVTGAAGKAGLHGMGGIGKTVLASMLASDPDVEAAFSDGIFWLTVGRTPRLEELQSQLAAALGEAEPVVTSVLGGKRMLQGCLKDRQTLVILDDVWENAHAQAFDVFQPPAQVLVTTRNAEILSRFGAVEHKVELLSEPASLELLARWAGTGAAALPAIAKQVAKTCGYLPLALAMVGAIVRRRPTGWDDALARLERVQLDKLESPSGDYPYPDLARALAASIDALEPGDRDRYVELAAFPEDTIVPEPAVATLWSLAGLDDLDTRDLLDRLEVRSLLQRTESGSVQLHDLQGSFLWHLVDDEPALHGRLVGAYAARCSDGFASGPNDGYFFERLPDHLAKAGRDQERRELLLSFPWVQAKLEATNIQILLADYRDLDWDEEIRFFHDALHLASHILVKDKSQLAIQIQARSLRRPEILLSFRDGARAARPAHSLVPRFPHRLDQAGGSVRQVLEGHTAPINSVAILDAGRVISASDDSTIRVWDLASSSTTQVLEGHSSSVLSVAVLGTAKVISGSADGTLRVWDLETGETLQILKGHAHLVLSVAVVDTRRAVSASSDKTLRLWDLEVGATLHVLKGHTDWVNSVVVVDGRRVVSASDDGTLRLWDLDSGTTLQIFEGHDGVVRSVEMLGNGHIVSTGISTMRVWDLTSGKTIHSLSHKDSPNFPMVSLADGRVTVTGITNRLLVQNRVPKEASQVLECHADSVSSIAVLDARRVVSASWDGTLRIWDLASGNHLKTLEGHISHVTSVAVPGADRLVSASWDQSLLVWDLRTGRILQTLQGHTRDIESVAVLDAKRVVSASRDKTLRVWNLESGETLQTFQGHTGNVNSVAVINANRMVSGSEDHTLRLWDLESGELLQILQGHTSSVNSVAVLDPERVASASFDQTLRVWSVVSGRILQILKGHTGGVNSVAVLGADRLVSASNDHSIRVWDLPSGRSIAAFHLDAPVTAVAVVTGSPQLVVAGDARGHVHVFELLEPSAELRRLDR